MKLIRRQLYTGKWYPLFTPWDVGCCDCGLTHRITFKQIKGKMMYKLALKPKLTKLARQKMKIIKVLRDKKG